MRFCEVQRRKGWTAGRPTDWSQEAQLIRGNERLHSAVVAADGSRNRFVLSGRLAEESRLFFFVFLTLCAGTGLEPFKTTPQIQTALVAVLTLQRL